MKTVSKLEDKCLKLMEENEKLKEGINGLTLQEYLNTGYFKNNSQELIDRYIQTEKTDNVINRKNNKKLINKSFSKSCSKNIFNKYYKLGIDIINKKDKLINLVNNFCSEKNIYKVKLRALRIVEYKKEITNNVSDIY